jgi:hypothetical protein
MSIDKSTVLAELERFDNPRQRGNVGPNFSENTEERYERMLGLFASVLNENEDLLYGLFWDEYTRWLQVPESEQRYHSKRFMDIFEGIVQKTTPRAVRFAGGLLLDLHYPVRDFVAEGLGRMGSVDAYTYLVAVIHHEDEQIASRAARALGEIGATQAVPLLVELVTHKVYTEQREHDRAMVQQYALAGLSLLDSPTAREAMERMTLREDLGQELRTDVLDTLFRKYGAEIVHLLRLLASDVSHDVSDLAIYYLNELEGSV